MAGKTDPDIGTKEWQVKKPFYQGYWSCSCHSFESHAAAGQAARQKFKVGDRVHHRCYDYVDYVVEVCDDEDGSGYVILKEHGQEHVQNLEI